MEPTDEELYRRSQKGDRRAFADLYERRGPSLYGYALHLSGSHAAAEEVTHDVFLRLIRPDAGFDAARGLLEGLPLWDGAEFIKTSDPRFGSTVMQLTNIARTEPDASLFQVPAGYTVNAGPAHGMHKTAP